MISTHKLSFLHRTYDYHLRAWLSHRWQDTSLVDDVVQETWLRVLRHSSMHEGDGTLLRWMLGIASNLAVSHHRSLHGRLTYVEQVPEMLYDAQVQHRLEVRQAFVRLLHSMSHLPREQQIAVLLVDYAGLTLAEASTSMHASSSALRSRLTRARKYLRHAAHEQPRIDVCILPSVYRPVGIDVHGVLVDAYSMEHRRSEYNAWRLMHGVEVHTWMPHPSMHALTH